ncbi:MAG: hypothetical protein ACPL4H_09345, partial [Anaerolineales bacterium]
SSFASARSGRAQSPFQVGLVVQMNGEIITRCVTVNKDQPTGYDVLAASGLDLITSASGMGVTVCSIQGVGCPASDCFCQSYSPPYYYWSYWHLQNGAWIYSNLGVSNFKVSPQGVEGWIWGDGKNAPANISFATICSSTTPTATWSATANPTVTLTSTSSVTPIRKTRKPSETSPVYVAPLVTSTPLPPTNFTRSDNGATATISPTATITLAYALQAQASSTPNLINPTSIPPSPTDTYNLGALSSTATALVLNRQLTPTPTSASFSLSSLIRTGFLAFMGMLGVLLLMFMIVLLRLRK